MKKEERIKERFRAWEVDLMKPYEEDKKQEPTLKAMLQEAKMTEE